MTTVAPILWWEDGAQIAVEAAHPTHVFAAGIDAHAAIELAVAHPDVVLSLILADPIFDIENDFQLLTLVTVPTLVVAAAPNTDTDLTVAQRLAGDIDNAVFVVIDDGVNPVHTGNRESFHEWSSSFVTIAEGLALRSGMALTPPTPLIEGAFR